MGMFTRSLCVPRLDPMRPGDIEIVCVETAVTVAVDSDDSDGRPSPWTYRTLNLAISFEPAAECRDLIRSACAGFGYTKSYSIVVEASSRSLMQLHNALRATDANHVTVVIVAPSESSVVVETVQRLREQLGRTFGARLAVSIAVGTTRPAQPISSKRSQSVERCQTAASLLQALVLCGAPHRMPDADVADVIEAIGDDPGTGMVMWETGNDSLLVPSRTVELLSRARRVLIVGSDHPGGRGTAKRLMELVVQHRTDLRGTCISMALSERCPLMNSSALRAAILVCS